MSFFKKTALLCTLAALCLTAAQAQKSRRSKASAKGSAAAGQSVTSIVFNGAPQYTPDELKAALGIQSDSFKATLPLLRGYAKQLLDSGLFEQSAFTLKNSVLSFQLKPTDQLYPMHFDNLPVDLGSDFDAKLHARLPLYHGQIPTDGAFTDSVSRFVEETLAAKGLKVTVSSAPESDPKTGKLAAVKFWIATPQVLVGPVEYVGLSPLMRPLVENEIKAIAFIPYSHKNSATYLTDAAEGVYLDKGYAAVQVKAEPKDGFTQTADSITIPYRLTVQEGRLYKYAGIKLPEGSPLTEADAKKVMRPPNVNPGTALALRNLWQAIKVAYLRQGFLDCTVTPKPLFDEKSGKVTYTAETVTGPTYHLAAVKFDALPDDLRRRIAPLWTMKPGDLYNSPAIDDLLKTTAPQNPAIAKLLNGRGFSYQTDADPTTHDVTLTVKVDAK